MKTTLTEERSMSGIDLSQESKMLMLVNITLNP